MSGAIGERLGFPAEAKKSVSLESGAVEGRKRVWFPPGVLPTMTESEGASQETGKNNQKRMWFPQNDVPGVEVTKTKRQTAPAAATTTVTGAFSLPETLSVPR